MRLKYKYNKIDVWREKMAEKIMIFLDGLSFGFLFHFIALIIFICIFFGIIIPSFK